MWYCFLILEVNKMDDDYKREIFISNEYKELMETYTQLTNSNKENKQSANKDKTFDIPLISPAFW